jgi:hypothetical protein
MSQDTIKFQPAEIDSWDHPYATALKQAYQSSIEGKDTLDQTWKNLHGMSGKKYRALINSLIKLIPNPRYLEIGSYIGSTACAAISRNKLKATCVDNWSQFGGPKDAFLSNINACLINSQCEFQLIENDFRKVDYNNIGKFNVYMFDGPHEAIDQYEGVTMIQKALDDTYILIVDDYNHDLIRENTIKALSDLNSTILASIEVITPWHGLRMETSDWHAGYFIAVIKK